jgi:hypothetical protein
MPVDTQYPHRLGGQLHMLGHQACPLTDLAALHERGRDKGPVWYRILPQTNRRGRRDDIVLLPATLQATLRRDLLGANRLYEAQEILEVSVCVV